MNNKTIYIIFLVSMIWSSVPNYTIRDIKETSNIELLNSNIYETSLISRVMDYNLIPLDDSNTKFKVSIYNGTSILKLGSPDLPKLTTSIIIPDNVDMELNIVSAQYTDFENINIAPSKGNVTRDIDPLSIPFVYSDEYKTNSFYPGNLAELDESFILRDLRGQTVVFYPVQYNPTTKTLRIYSEINIEIVANQNSLSINSKSRNSNKISTSNEFLHIYEDLFINNPNDTRFEYLTDEGKMLIICYDDFLDEMQPLVDWKNRKGIHTTIVGISNIGSDVSSLQNYIDSYYYENGLTYLLLVGDINQIPTHIVNGAASDPSFGFIEGGDSFSEVIVGRFSANNPVELQTQIDRTLSYEINPEIVDHLDKALGIGSTQGPGYGGLTDDQFQELLWNDFLSNYTYNSFEGLYDGSGSVAQGVAAINEGVGIINYTGHAGPTGWGNGAPLGVNDVNALVNTGKLPFIFTVGCNPGEFNNFSECFCEAWLRATDDDGNPTGAVGHLGSTISQSWEPPMHGQWAMNSILTESYGNDLSRSFGGIAVNGCMHMNEAQGSYGINETNHWTIFGDPSLLIRTNDPSQINPEYNGTIFIGEEEFIVDVGIDGALVALSKNNELLSQSFSIGGVAILDLSNVSVEPGEIDLVITSFNTYPYINTLNVIVPDGAYLVYHDYEVVNSSDIEHMIQYGDVIELNLLIENVGTMNANAINIEVSSSDEHITMLESNSGVAYAITDEISTTATPVSFSVSNSVPDGHIATFEVSLDNGDENWNFNFNIVIHAPVFEVLNPVLTDANADNVWDPGEIATIDVDLVNSGSAGFGYYPGSVITTDNPYVTILSSEGANTFYGIDANTTYEGQFSVQADSATPMGTVVDFNISWGYSSIAPCGNETFSGEGCIEQANYTYSVIIGHPSVLIWDPSLNHTSGDRLVDYFDEIGFNGYDYVLTTDIPDLDNYMTAFIFLGIYPNNFVLQENIVGGFVNMLSEGKNIYLEGADTWAFDMQTSLHDFFGLLGVADGTSDFSSAVGSVDSFAEGYSFSYNGENNYIDQLSPAGGFSLLENDVAGYITTIAYENMLMGYRTIGSSHELGGLQGANFHEYIQSILSFFDEGYDNGGVDPLECVIGDLNFDDSIDVTDVIRVVNIITNAGEVATDLEICAADLNFDSSINVLDVLVIVNIILDERLARNRSANAIKEVGFTTYDNFLEIVSTGSIKGIQLLIESSGDIYFENQENMEIAHNVIDNLHHILVYSFSGHSINDNIFTLFKSDEEFKIIEALVSNTNQQLVDIKYKDGILPETFTLKQNFPNPFNPVTNINIEIGFSDNIELKIFDIRGREIISLYDGNIEAGTYSFQWNGRNGLGELVSSGIYFYTLSNNSIIKTRKMLLMK